jgi:hypothetical protein
MLDIRQIVGAVLLFVTLALELTFPLRYDNMVI